MWNLHVVKYSAGLSRSVGIPASSQFTYRRRYLSRQIVCFQTWTKSEWFKPSGDGVASQVNTGRACVHCAKSLQSCPTLCDPMDCSPQAPLSMGFSRQEYRSGFPCPPPGDLQDPGVRSASLMSSALAGWFFATRATWEALAEHNHWEKCGGK